MAIRVIKANAAFVKKVLAEAGIKCQGAERHRKCKHHHLWVRPGQHSRGHCDTKAERLAREARVEGQSTATWLSHLPKEVRKKLQPHLPTDVVFCPEHGVAIKCQDVWGEYDRGRKRWQLHREDGPAVGKGAKAVFYWQGRAVKRGTVLDEPTAERILKEENVTDREVLIRRMGTEKFVAQAGLTERSTFTTAGGTNAVLMTKVDPKLLDASNADGSTNWEVRQKARTEQLSYLKVTCPSTGTVYFLRVEPRLETAKAALEWTAGGDVQYEGLAHET